MNQLFALSLLIAINIVAAKTTNTYRAFAQHAGNSYGTGLRLSAPQVTFGTTGYSHHTGIPLVSGYTLGGTNIGYGTGYGTGYGIGYGTGYGLGGNIYRTGSLLNNYGLTTTTNGYGALAGNIAARQRVVTVPVSSAAAAYPVSAVPATVAIGGIGANLASAPLLSSARASHAFEPVVPAAVQQISRTVEYRPMPYQDAPGQPQVIEVEPSDNPVHLHFKTRSSSLSVSQTHTPAAAPEVQTAAAQDEPARLITEVHKPVVQEVREVITPYRQVTQEINPVIESLHTVVSKGEGSRVQYSGAANIGAANLVSGQNVATTAAAVVPIGAVVPPLQHHQQQQNYVISTGNAAIAPATGIAAVQAVQPVATYQQAIQAVPTAATYAATPVIVTGSGSATGNYGIRTGTGNYRSLFGFGNGGYGTNYRSAVIGSGTGFATGARHSFLKPFSVNGRSASGAVYTSNKFGNTYQ